MFSLMLIAPTINAAYDEETRLSLGYPLPLFTTAGAAYFPRPMRKLCKRLWMILPNIDMKKIDKIIDETPYISDLQKEFYKTMLRERKERILDFSYQKLRKRERH